MATDSMDIDMDMDPELARYQAEAAQLSAMPDLPLGDDEAMNVVEDGELAGDEIAGNKVYLAGLDELGRQDVHNFASDHFKGKCQVEWINDTSATLVYATNEEAADALKAFSAEPSDDPLQERRAVELATHPHVALYVRMARNTDVKEKGAAARSRYYLMHPKEDPDSRPRRHPRRRGSRRGRYEGRRQSSDEGSNFDVALYDDDPVAKAATAKRKMSIRSEDDLFTGRRTVRRVSGRDGDLIVDRKEGRLRDRSRDRSASPVREGDGKYGFSDDQPYRKTARYRSPPPPRARSNHAARDKLRTELFPSKKTGTPLTNGHVDTKRPVELFPPPATANQPVELFPRNSSSSFDLFPDKVNHRRQDAKDLGPDEVATAIGRRPENARERNGSGRPRDLFDRINGPAGRLTDDFSIRGAGVSQGFSIKGASRDNDFGGDLFAHKMKGRGQRKTADDLF